MCFPRTYTTQTPPASQARAHDPEVFQEKETSLTAKHLLASLSGSFKRRVR